MRFLPMPVSRPTSMTAPRCIPGQQLTEGASNPHRILRILGEEATRLYLLSEVQKVYRNQGVNIADKHFEIIVRKMLSKVQVTRSGDSELLPDELIDRLQLMDINGKVAGGRQGTRSRHTRVAGNLPRRA